MAVRSPQNFAHAMSAQLSCYVQNFMTLYLSLDESEIAFSSNSNVYWKIVSEMGLCLLLELPCSLGEMELTHCGPKANMAEDGRQIFLKYVHASEWEWFSYNREFFSSLGSSWWSVVVGLGNGSPSSYLHQWWTKYKSNAMRPQWVK